ncbi:unnamed protein product, partial [marine sediment metagenome]
MKHIEVIENEIKSLISENKDFIDNFKKFKNT